MIFLYIGVQSTFIWTVHYTSCKAYSSLCWCFCSAALATILYMECYRIGAISSFHFPSTRDTIYIICLIFIALNANACDCCGRVVIVLAQILYCIFFVFESLCSIAGTIHIDELFNSTVGCLEDMLHCFPFYARLIHTFENFAAGWFMPHLLDCNFIIRIQFGSSGISFRSCIPLLF